MRPRCTTSARPIHVSTMALVRRSRSRPAPREVRHAPPPVGGQAPRRGMAARRSARGTLGPIGSSVARRCARLGRSPRTRPAGASGDQPPRQSRPLVAPVVDGTSATVRGTVQGVSVEAEADLGNVDWGQPARFRRLDGYLGPWGLALLEAIVIRPTTPSPRAFGSLRTPRMSECVCQGLPAAWAQWLAGWRRRHGPGSEIEAALDNGGRPCCRIVCTVARSGRNTGGVLARPGASARSADSRRLAERAQVRTSGDGRRFPGSGRRSAKYASVLDPVLYADGLERGPGWQGGPRTIRRRWAWYGQMASLPRLAAPREGRIAVQNAAP